MSIRNRENNREWKTSWHALASTFFFNLPFSQISTKPGVNKCSLISGNIVCGEGGKGGLSTDLIEMNYMISVCYVAWRVVDHLVKGGVPTSFPTLL